jgi:uncharacterized membrane protein (UPF0182 family)
VAPRVPISRHRGRWWLLAIVIVFIILLASLRSLAALYTDRLWFSSVNLTSVWNTLLGVKLGLFASFGGLFFVLLWVNLIVCDRVSSSVEGSDPEDELVRRYQRMVRPYSNRIYAGVSVVVALIAAAGAIGQWQNWLLFTHAQSFGVKDPQFHMDAGFYVFKLPFLEFLVNWLIVSLIVVLVFTAVFHYLNGGIRTQRVTPRVRPVVKAHLSVLLALIALAKAAGYVLAKYQLVTSTNGFVEGAGYTDVHARIPALELLFWISLAAAGVLLWNIRRQGWTLPILAVGLWAFVALVIGVIYPAIAQAIVNPSQNSKEAPYIARNIAGTRAAYGLNHVATSNFAASTSLTAEQVLENFATLANIRLWDPNPQISLQTFNKLQYAHGYYSFQGLAVDRYEIGPPGHQTLQPVLVGVREINGSGIASPTWVNTHLQFTHGEGIDLAQANAANSTGDPVFDVKNVPPSSSDGLPKVTQPDVYFGLNSPGYVVADTKENEIGSGNPHYQGNGGVQLSSLLKKAAFAIRLGDFNLLISGQVTHDSRIIFVRDIQAMAQKAAPFLSWDSDPYAVLDNGHIDWILDGYTTTANYPYSQNASSVLVPSGSGLPASYNYVRNSVKLVINAYTGSMTFYAMDNDPILRTYESAFPGMFTPASSMPKSLQQHLRYPEDLFSVQASLYGRYHLSSNLFYNANGAWSLSPTSGAGSPSQPISVTITTNAQNQAISGSITPMSPVYQVLQLPGQSQQSFNISDAYVPFNAGASSQNLSAFIFGTYDAGAGPQLHVYETPGDQTIGPALAESEIQQNSTVSSDITLLDQHGSSVLLGNILPVPVGNAVIYVRPLYVESTSNPLPELNDVITVLGSDVQIQTTVSASLADLLKAPLPPTGTAGSSSSSSSLAAATQAEVKALLADAQADYTAAQAALTSGGTSALAQYQTEIDAMEQVIQQADALLNPAGTTTTSPTTSTTTTTVPKIPKSKAKTTKATSTALAGSQAGSRT